MTSPHEGRPEPLEGPEAPDEKGLGNPEESGRPVSIEKARRRGQNLFMLFRENKSLSLLYGANGFGFVRAFHPFFELGLELVRITDAIFLVAAH